MLASSVNLTRRILLVSVPARNHFFGKRTFSMNNYFASILPFKSPEHTRTEVDMMNEIQELQLEKKRLEDKIKDLVGQLESKKRPEEIRVRPDQVLKSEEEQEAAAALERLELKEQSQGQPRAEPVATTPSVTKSESKGGKKGAKPAAKEPEKPIDVSRLDLRIGKIVEVSKHPDADSLYVEKIDCGEASGPRTVISGLVNHVPIDQMQDRLLVVLCNLKPVKMRGILSEAMVMCASTPEKVEILGVPDNVKPGDRVVFEKYPGDPDAQLNPKKKVWEQVSPDIKTNAEGVAMYKDCFFKVAGNEGFFKSTLKNVNIR